MAREPGGLARRPGCGIGASTRKADTEERKKLHRLGDDPVVATLHVADADTCLQVAASATHRQALLGPFEAAGEDVRETQSVGAQSNGPHHA
jgi:hypothetical protein